MLTYEPGDSPAHRLDPRAKLAFQVGFAAAAFAHPTPAWLAGLAVLALGSLAAARLSPWRALAGYRVVLAVLALGPVLAALTPGPPWVRLGPALESLLAVGRVVVVLPVSAAFVNSTPVRDTRAAVQRTVPGRFGRLLGLGVALTFRLVPVVRTDVARVRTAVAARGGAARPVHERARLLSVRSVERAFDRADRLSLALQARCLAWNPTLPELRFSRRDYPVLALAGALAAAALV